MAIFVEENYFENAVCKMATILSCPQCIKQCVFCAERLPEVIFSDISAKCLVIQNWACFQLNHVNIDMNKLTAVLLRIGKFVQITIITNLPLKSKIFYWQESF